MLLPKSTFFQHEIGSTKILSIFSISIGSSVPRFFNHRGIWPLDSESAEVFEDDLIKKWTPSNCILISLTQLSPISDVLDSSSSDFYSARIQHFGYHSLHVRGRSKVLEQNIGKLLLPIKVLDMLL